MSLIELLNPVPMDFLEYRFWEKLFYVGVMVGYGVFLYYVMDMFIGWNTKLKKIVVQFKKEMEIQRCEIVLTKIGYYFFIDKWGNSK